MTRIQRYSMEPPSAFRRNPSGRWVMSSDVEALEEKLRSALEALDFIIGCGNKDAVRVATKALSGEAPVPAEGCDPKCNWLLTNIPTWYCTRCGQTTPWKHGDDKEPRASKEGAPAEGMCNPYNPRATWTKPCAAEEGGKVQDGD